jgi:hypothetical protein
VEERYWSAISGGGYYNQKDDADCIWLVKRGRGILADYGSKVFVEVFRGRVLIRREGSLWGGEAALANDTDSKFFRTTEWQPVDAYVGAKEILQKDNPAMRPFVIKILLHGQRILEPGSGGLRLEPNSGKGPDSGAGKDRR